MSDSHAHLSRIREEQIVAGTLPLRLRLESEHFHSPEIQCLPGHITIIREHANDMWPFRDALIGRHTGLPVGLYRGELSIDPEDLTHFTLPSEEWLERTFYQALDGGVNQAVKSVSELLDGEGLANDLGEPLSEEEKQAFTLVRCLQSETQVLHIDAPFLDASAEWVERFAKRILELVEDTRRVCIITGLTSLPSLWKDVPLVDLWDIKLSTQEEREASKVIERKLAHEAIPNPYVEEFAASEAEEGVSFPKRRRNDTVGLTRLSRISRLRQALLVGRRKYKKYIGMLTPIRITQSVLPSKKADYWFRHIEVKRFLALAGMLLLLFFVTWSTTFW